MTDKHFITIINVLGFIIGSLMALVYNVGMMKRKLNEIDNKVTRP